MSSNGNDPENPPTTTPPSTTGVVTTPAAWMKSLTTEGPYAMVMEDLVLASGRNKILRGVTLAVPSGVLYGILGESGAGKTTLLRLIARKLDETVLSITGKGFLPSEIWYIAQEDVLYQHDTPRRSVSFLHRLLHGSSSAEADAKAEELLDMVQFPLQVIDRPIGTTDDGLSVGSRRLLNVAMALCAKAKVVMMDEPTTGLDSTSAANLVRTVADICHTRGLTAICTIHQPSDDALRHFDEVTVMSEGQAFYSPALNEQGMDAPLGQAAQIDNIDQFSKAELLMLEMKARTLVPTQLPAKWSKDEKDQYLEGATFESQLASLNAVEEPPFLRQFVRLTERIFYRNWANFWALRFRFGIVLLLFTLLGFTFYQMPYDDPTYLREFIGLCTGAVSCTFVPIVLAAGFFPSEKPSFVHEVSQSKRPGVLPYAVARTMYDIAVAIICSVSVLVMMAIVGVETDWAGFWFTFVLQTMCSDSFGLSLSIRFPPEVSIGAMIPGIGFLFVLCGTGIVIPPKEGGGWIYHVLKWVAFFKYGFTAMAQPQLEAMTGECIPLLEPSCVYSNANSAIEFLQFETEGFLSTSGFNWMMLIIIFLCFRVLIFVQLMSLRAASKFSYKAATNWEEKLQKDTERKAKLGEGEVDGEVQEFTQDVLEEKAEPHHAQGTTTFLPGIENTDIDFTLTWDLQVTATHREGFFTVKKKTLLPQQKGFAKSGEVLGILGPGSSGKTVLLKALSAFLPISGFVDDDSRIEIACNFNCDPDSAPHAPPGVRFVYQYDAFVTGDTVTSAIIRQLEFSMKQPKDKHAEICEAIIGAMGLAHVASKKADEISGGQMRRLSIACQLAHSPRILLLDEPTSGLDSELAQECMETLRRFALLTNSVVICTLNQPGKRLLPTVDKFLFLQGGEAVFQGDLDTARVAFGVDDCGDGKIVTDLILEKLNSPHHAVTTVTRSSTSPFPNDSPSEAPKNVLDIAAVRAMNSLQPENKLGNQTVYINVDNSYQTQATFFGLLVVLIKRNIASRTNKPLQYLGEILFKFIIYPVLVSVMFAQVDDPFLSSRFGVNFLILISTSFTCFVTPVVLFALERNVYEREARASDYHPVTYVLARWITETIPDIILCIIGFTLMYFIVGFEGNLPLFFGLACLNYLYSYGVGSILAVIPFPLFVNCGFAAFCTIVYMLGSDLLVTPLQIDRVKFIHSMEVITPTRFASVLQIRNEAETTTFGAGPLLSQLGLDRTGIDDPDVMWICFIGGLVALRFIALANATLIVWLDKSTVRKMHPKRS